MMSKNAERVSESNDNSDSKIQIDKASLFKSSCQETLEDGKLVLSYADTGDKEPIHTGKWTDEEMAYAEGLIDEFKAGNLALPDGTSLRQFLSKMLNCSPKRISKRYEGNNYSKGRKFYVKSSEKLDLAEAQRRRSKLQFLERRHKKKLLQLKIPHLLIADTVEDVQDVQEGEVGVENRRVPVASVASRELGGISPSGLAGSSLSSVMAAGMTTNESARVASLHSSFHEMINANRPLSNASVGNDFLSDIASRPPRSNVQDLLTQFRSQQAEAQRLNRLLELQRGFNSDIGNLRLHQQIMRTSLMQRDLGPALSPGDPITSLLSANRSPHTGDNSNLGLTYQLQMLLRAEEARNAARQDPSLPSAVSDLSRSTPLDSTGNASESTLLSSLVSSGQATTAHLSLATNSQVGSLMQMQLQARQQTMSSSQRLSPVLGSREATIRQEHKTNNEGVRGEFIDGNRQARDSLMSSVASRTGTGAADQASLYLSDPARLLAAQSLSLSSPSSARAPSSAFSQRSTAELANLLRQQSRTSFTGGAANQGMAMPGQKRNADEVDYSNNSSSGNSRRRLM